MPWKIIQQQDGDNGLVDAKLLKFYPEECPETLQVKWKPMTMVCWRVLFAHDKAQDQVWKITHTRFGWNITCPPRLVPKNDNPCCTEMVEAPGRAINGRDKTGAKSLGSIMPILAEIVGKELAEKIIFAILDAQSLARALAA